MTGEETYQNYCALKAHFNSESFNFLKYGKTKYYNWDRRRDKPFFEFIANKLPSSEIVPFFVANFIRNNDIWIGEISYREGYDVYLKWKGRVESLSYTFTEDMKNIKEFLSDRNLKFISLFDINNNHPIIFRFLLSDMITIETFVIMNSIQNYFNLFTKKLYDDLLWEKWCMICTKYDYFLKYDMNKFKEILKNQFV